MSDMNDLVKRGDVLAILRESGWFDGPFLEEFVKEVPTAYNVEKVVEKIKEAVPLYTGTAIEIVKKGGVDYKGLSIKKGKPLCNKNTKELTVYLENHGMIDDEVKDTCIYALEKVEKYEALERQLVQVYGECDDLLEEVVKGLVRYEKAPSENVDKSRLLTNEDADKWEKYKQIMEELPITVKKVCIDGEYIWVVKNEDTNKMSTGFTRKQAIDKYVSGKTFDAEEWEREQEDFTL